MQCVCPYYIWLYPIVQLKLTLPMRRDTCNIPKMKHSNNCAELLSIKIHFIDWIKTSVWEDFKAPRAGIISVLFALYVQQPVNWDAQDIFVK